MLNLTIIYKLLVIKSYHLVLVVPGVPDIVQMFFDLPKFAYLIRNCADLDVSFFKKLVQIRRIYGVTKIVSKNVYLDPF